MPLAVNSTELLNPSDRSWTSGHMAPLANRLSTSCSTFNAKLFESHRKPEFMPYPNVLKVLQTRLVVWCGKFVIKFSAKQKFARAWHAIIICSLLIAPEPSKEQHRRNFRASVVSTSELIMKIAAAATLKQLFLIPRSFFFKWRENHKSIFKFVYARI